MAAGKPVADIFGRKFVTAWKPDASPVTEADRAAEAVIIPLLRDGLLPGFQSYPRSSSRPAAYRRLAIASFSLIRLTARASSSRAVPR